MRNIFLIALTIFIFNMANLFDTKVFFDTENFADAQYVTYYEEEYYDDEEVTENFAEEVLYYVNIEREKEGLNPLRLSQQLNKFADIRAKEITQTFSHTRPNGKSCFTVIKIPYRYVGENIAAGQPSPKSVVKSWMESPGHRANILSKNFGKMGIGYAYDSETDYKHYWAQLFKD